MKMRLFRIGYIVRDGLFNAFRFIDAALKTSVFFEVPGSGFPRAPKALPERSRKPLPAHLYGQKVNWFRVDLRPICNPRS